MFYNGDLQSAISEAVEKSKLVSCFVTDSGEESQLWENDFLQDQKIKEKLSDKSVLLRLEAGSKEAGYLTAIFPIPKTPTFVIIHNGQLKEYLTSGVAKEEFLRRLISVLLPDDKTLSETSPTTLASEALGQGSTQAQTTTQISNTTEASSISKPEKNAKDEDDTIASEPIPQVSNRNSTLADQNYALMQKKRQDKEERARILQRVEDDKINRRNEAARRRAERECCSNTSRNGKMKAGSSSKIPNSLSHDTSSLLIRLFDGSTIRTKFPCTATLSNEVRDYISHHQSLGTDQPYVFKHVLSPLPNRKIEAAEETQSLQDLGCVPSATLIMAPISVYTEAYSGEIGASASDLVGGALNSGWKLVRGGLGLVTGVVGAAFGGGSVDNRADSYQRVNNGEHSTSEMSSTKNVGTKINGLQERNRVDEPQFYNGNSVNFQPRPKDQDEEQRKTD